MHCVIIIIFIKVSMFMCIHITVIFIQNLDVHGKETHKIYILIYIYIYIYIIREFFFFFFNACLSACRSNEPLKAFFGICCTTALGISHLAK